MTVSSVRALQLSAIAVATILNGSSAIATVTGHPAPQCVRLSSEMGDESLPVLVFQTANARERGGLVGSYLVDVEVYAVAATMPGASDLLATAIDELTAIAFAGVGLDAVPDTTEPSDTEPLDPNDVPYPESQGVATTLTLAVFIPS